MCCPSEGLVQFEDLSGFISLKKREREREKKDYTVCHIFGLCSHHRILNMYSKMTNRTNGISLNVRYSVIIPPLDGYGLQCNSSQMSWKQLLVDLSNIYWNKGVIFSLDTGIFAC